MLSNPQVISLLNRYFVPVYIANEDYRDAGKVPVEERRELRRIHKEGYSKNLSVGTVHAYVLSPAGDLMDSLHVAQAAKPENMKTMLQRTVQKLGTKAGEPIVKPTSERGKPQTPPGSILLHITTRYLERRGEDYVLVEGNTGNWSDLPGEDWIWLSPVQQAQWLNQATIQKGGSWEMNRNITALLVNRFYPPTENNDLSKNRITDLSFRATVIEWKNGFARARIEGSFAVKHPFYHQDDPNVASGSVIGYLDFDPGKQSIRSLRLVTDHAHYGKQPFGVAVRSLP